MAGPSLGYASKMCHIHSPLTSFYGRDISRVTAPEFVAHTHLLTRVTIPESVAHVYTFH